MPTIGLSMIVKNEAKLIRRCLESAAPLIDYIIVSDTGSTDGTQDIIQQFGKEIGVPTVVAGHEWSDFCSNRNLALMMLRHYTTAHYAFVIDADDTLEIAKDFDIAAWKAGMSHDVYDLPVRHMGVLHYRPQIFRNRPNCKWKGVLHEYLEISGDFTRATAHELTIQATIEGSRNLDPQKFAKDAEILEQALKDEKDEYLRLRYMFYLAQSYRDSNQDDKALLWYAERSKFGGWNQEIYISQIEAICCCTRMGLQLDAAQPYFQEAIKILPERAEAYHAMAFLCRKLGKNQEGMEIAASGLEKITVPSGLFSQPWIYDYGLRDEYAVNAYWAGQHLECLKHSLLILSNQNCPPDQVKRFADNSLGALEKLMARFVSNTSLVFSD